MTVKQTKNGEEKSVYIFFLFFLLRGGSAQLLALARCEPCAATAFSASAGRGFYSRRFASLPCEPVHCFNLRVLKGSNSPPLIGFSPCVATTRHCVRSVFAPSSAGNDTSIETSRNFLGACLNTI